MAGGKRGNQFANVPKQNNATTADIGISRKDIHDARIKPPAREPSKPNAWPLGERFTTVDRRSNAGQPDGVCS